MASGEVRARRACKLGDLDECPEGDARRGLEPVTTPLTPIHLLGESQPLSLPRILCGEGLNVGEWGDCEPLFRRKEGERDRMRCGDGDFEESVRGEWGNLRGDVLWLGVCEVDGRADRGDWGARLGSGRL